MAAYRPFSGLCAEWGAVILAAGRGHRMGGPKAWQTWYGRSFLEWILDVLRCVGTPPVAVVVAPDTPPLPCGYPRPIRRLVNPRPDSGPAGSLWLAWRRVVDPEHWCAVLMWPVDFPAVPPDVVHRLIEAYRTDRSGTWFWRPNDGTRPGHPILLHRVVGRWLSLPPVHRHGMRYLQRLFIDRVADVEVHTPAIHWNMNTPAHLHRYAPVWQPENGPGSGRATGWRMRRVHRYADGPVDTGIRSRVSGLGSQVSGPRCRVSGVRAPWMTGYRGVHWDTPWDTVSVHSAMRCPVLCLPYPVPDT